MGGSKYYKGVVTSVDPANGIGIDYDDGDREDAVPLGFVKLDSSKSSTYVPVTLTEPAAEVELERAGKQDNSCLGCAMSEIFKYGLHDKHH